MRPDDLASARAWADEIRHEGWPLDPIATAASAITSARCARWVTVATVIAGSGGCGPTLRTTHGYGSEIAWPIDAAAPVGVQLGDRLIAVVMARATPDRCGRTARVVRAYAAPVGVTLDKFQGVFPPNLTPSVE